MRTSMNLLALVLSVLCASACSETSSPAGGDMTATKDMSVNKPSQCGKPGDTGNSKGVGKYCEVLNDCGDNTGATICSSLGNGATPSADDTYFCTMVCTAGNNAACGENATCQCQGGQCGCTHDRCAAPNG